VLEKEKSSSKYSSASCGTKTDEEARGLLTTFIEEQQKKILFNISLKKKIKVAFFVVHQSVWQYDDLYRIMVQDELFDPVIIVVPYRMYGKSHMGLVMEECYESFKKINYNTLKTYDEKEDSYLDIYTKLKPDIIFFTNPHDLTTPKYRIDYWCDKALTCYVPYALRSSNLYYYGYNLLFQNIVWRNFYETSIHYDLALMHSNNKAKNVFITGYPKCDIFLDKNYKPKNVWKIKNKNVKKIIWSPHHSIEENSEIYNTPQF